MHEHHREPPCCACPGCGQACDDCTCGPSTDSDIRAAASRVLNEVAVHDSESLSGSLLSFERDVTMLARFALDTLAGRPTVPDSVTCDACGQRIAEGRIEVLVDGTAVHVRHSAR